MLTNLRIRPRRLRPARRGASIVRRLPRRRGARVTYRLNQPARVTFRIQRRVKRRFKTLGGSFAHPARAGANALRFSGRLRRRALRPGRYRLVATPRGGTGARIVFRVRR